MLTTKQEIFNTIELISIFFILLVTIIIIVAILYYNRRRVHAIEKSNFQSILTQTQFEVQEQTMQTIGADLHDNIGQLLSLTSLTLNSIELEDEAKARQKIDDSIDLTLRSIKEMRQLGKLLQGDQLVSLGLPEAIKYEIGWMERSGKFKVEFIEDGRPKGSNTDKDLILFRILQETINNTIKHAVATEISIKLKYPESHINLSISDNGVGFDASNLPAGKRGMGLQNIQKRAGIIGGTVDLQSAPGSGTAVNIIIPYP